jgi:hypothetical protein
MNHGRKNGEVVPAFHVGCTDEHGRLVPCDAVDEIGPVKSLVRGEIPGSEM